METTFATVSGSASANEDGQVVIDPIGTERWVQLVLDDSNWNLYRSTTKKSAAATRALIPHAGVCGFRLEPGQGLYIWAKLATGGAGSVWDLSVTVSDYAP